MNNKTSHAHRQGMIQTTFWLLLAFLLLLEACAKPLTHPNLDVTFIPNKGEFLSREGMSLSKESVAALAQGKDYILIGENHKNAIDHKVQQEVLTLLAQAKTPPVIGLEMISVDKQPILDDFNNGMVEISTLEEELEWKSSWGYPFSLFKDHFAIIERNSLPVAGLNIPKELTQKIAAHGLSSLSEAEKTLLPRQIILPDKKQNTMLEMVFKNHKGKDKNNQEQKDRFILIQSLWDSKMADEAVKLHRKYGWPVLIIAGSAHVANGWGIALRLKQFDPHADILSIMPWRGGPFKKEKGDIFFYSPETYHSKIGATLTVQGTGGLLVEAIERDSRAAKAGLRPRDVLWVANGRPLNNLGDLHRAGMLVHNAGTDLVFLVLRGQTTFQANIGKLTLPATSRKPSRTMAKKIPQNTVKTE